jgi:RNA polymerase sigma-70 factor (ECF subfamily)
LAIERRIVPYRTLQQHWVSTFNILCIVVVMDLSDPQTFRRVFETHERGVHGAAMRILGDPAQAQDVVQDVFLRVWRRPGAFDASRGELGSYLRLMARSRALDLWREGQAAGRATDRLKIVAGSDAPRVEELPDAAADRQATREDVREALRALPEGQRDALVLAYWGGMTANEIAEREHLPLGTAKSRLRLGLARLRQECPAFRHEAA